MKLAVPSGLVVNVAIVAQLLPFVLLWTWTDRFAPSWSIRAVNDTPLPQVITDDEAVSVSAAPAVTLNGADVAEVRPLELATRV